MILAPFRDVRKFYATGVSRPFRACNFSRGSKFAAPIFMRTLAATATLLLALTSSFVTAAEPEVRREILGIRLDMTKEEVEKRLKEIGKFVRDERKQQQVWEAKDKSFSHIIVGMRRRVLVCATSRPSCVKTRMRSGFATAMSKNWKRRDKPVIRRSRISITNGRYRR